MNSSVDRKTYYGLVWFLVIFIVLADQLSKAYFVWLLGTHDASGFMPFLQEYFAIFASSDLVRGIQANYQPFKPLIWVWEPWIAWNLTTNTGAAWSMFKGNSFYLSFVSIGMAALIYFVWWKYFRFNAGMSWALGGIIGGALGNFVDRFRLREVVDFADVKIPLIGKLFPRLGDPYDFPIFNVADSTAVCGTIALAVYLITVDIIALRNKKSAPARSQSAVHAFPEGPQLDNEAVEQLKLKRDAKREALARMHEHDHDYGSFDIDEEAENIMRRVEDDYVHGTQEPAELDVRHKQHSDETDEQPRNTKGQD